MNQGDVYRFDGAKTTRHRRVIAIVGDDVCYSTGGDKNKFCSVETFAAWIAKKNVRLVHNGGQKE